VKATALDVAGDGSQVYLRAAAAVEPDPRTVLLQLLGRAEHVVTLLTALLATTVFLMLDAATLVSFLQRRAVHAQPGQKRSAMPLAVGMAWGAGLLFAMARLGAGSSAPINAWGLLLGGSVVGLAVSALATRMSPIGNEPYLAGMSLGMNDAQILREI